MRKIKTTFSIDPFLDINGYLLVKDYIGLIDWTNFEKPKDLSEISDRVTAYHKEHAQDLQNFTVQTEKVWRTKEDTFIRLVLSDFLDTDLPNEEYVCYPTIWPLVARDPQNHRVAFPINDNPMIVCAVLAHEFLHEVFFRHLFNLYSAKYTNATASLWEISEIVNYFIMSSQRWQTEFPFITKPYTIHTMQVQKFDPLWRDSKNLDNFLEMILPLYE